MRKALKIIWPFSWTHATKFGFLAFQNSKRNRCPYYKKKVSSHRVTLHRKKRRKSRATFTETDMSVSYLKREFTKEIFCKEELWWLPRYPKYWNSKTANETGAHIIKKCRLTESHCTGKSAKKAAPLLLRQIWVCLFKYFIGNLPQQFPLMWYQLAQFLYNKWKNSC